MLHRKACIRFTPPPCRMPLSLYTGIIRAYPGTVSPPGFDIAYLFSTRHERFTFVRLPDSHLTGSCPAFCLNAHHNGSLPLQLKVVWSQLLQADSEGPSLIFPVLVHGTRTPTNRAFT